MEKVLEIPVERDGTNNEIFVLVVNEETQRGEIKYSRMKIAIRDIVKSEESNTLHFKYEDFDLKMWLEYRCCMEGRPDKKPFIRVCAEDEILGCSMTVEACATLDRFVKDLDIPEYDVEKLRCARTVLYLDKDMWRSEDVIRMDRARDRDSEMRHLSFTFGWGSAVPNEAKVTSLRVNGEEVDIDEPYELSTGLIYPVGYFKIGEELNLEWVVETAYYPYPEVYGVGIWYSVNDRKILKTKTLDFFETWRDSITYTVEGRPALSEIESLLLINKSDIPEEDAAGLAEKGERIKVRLQKHKQWLDTGEAEGEQFIAKKERLVGVDFYKTDLRDAQFIECNLTLANFLGCDLRGQAMFQRCDLTRTTFIQAEMEGVQIGDCTLHKTSFRSANLEKAEINGMYKDGDPIAEIDFRYANLKSAKIQFVDFRGASVDEAVLEKTYFGKCNMSGLEFTKMEIRSSLLCERCDMEYCIFESLFIEGSRFTKCDLRWTLFRKALLKGSEFLSGCDLQNSSFQDASLQESLFENAVCNNADISGADMSEVEMRGAVLRGADFRKATLTNGDFSDSDFTGAFLDDTTIKHLANFTAATWLDGSTCGTASIGHCVPLQKE